MRRENLYGRLEPMSLLYMNDETTTDVDLMPAIQDGVCQRCMTKTNHVLPDGVLYCWACANLGRLSERDVLLHLPEPGRFCPTEPVCDWRGQLTKAQEKIAHEMCESFIKGRSHLTYAVTGAGKTEMMFPLLRMALEKGCRVAFVSPRVDVVVEILPRLRTAFTVPICALYGGSPAEYQYTQFVIATTHQLLRFKAAFDLIVVDEVDAFPFAENAMLAGALSRALRPQGVVSYLTATPSQRLQKQVRNGQLKQSVLSRRYHGHPLPNFRLKVVRGWRARLPNLLINLCRDYRRSGQPFLVFVPEVADLINVRAQLVAKVPGLMIGTTHATAVDRQESVKKMRQGELQGLVTTTILERGVTFPGIDVVILGADEHVFSQSALVQIAGRCGRSQARPTGLVLAIVTEKTRVLMRARAEIDYLNKLRTADDV